MDDGLKYQQMRPAPAVAHFVESFWMLQNNSGKEREVVVLPDGRIDLFLSQAANEAFHITLLGLGTKPSLAVIPPASCMFAISFNLLATEYILQRPVADLIDTAANLPVDYMGFDAADMKSFERFCIKATENVLASINGEIDERKRNLFSLLYSSQGLMTIKELSEKVFWSSRQMNRYFHQQYGISVKTYCNILRFRASFGHIKEGKLFPQLDFTDQAHFIKEVKRFSGTVPKELYRNNNDRFIQFSTLKRK